MSLKNVVLASIGVGVLAVAPFAIGSVTNANAQPAPTSTIGITKNWKGIGPEFTPTYSVVCKGQDPFTGTASAISARQLPFGTSCTVSEVVVPNNGWIEQQDPQQVVIGRICDDLVEKVWDEEGTPNEGCESSVTFTNVAVPSITVNKTAFASQTRSWEWSLNKTVDQAEVNVGPGESKTVKYTITPSAVPTITTQLSGTITVSNLPWQYSEDYTVTDAGVRVTDCTIPDDDSKYATPSCRYSGIVVPNDTTTNTATVRVNFGEDYEEYTGTAKVVAPEGVEDIDRFAVLTDAYDGADPVVLNDEVDALSPRVETYTKTYTNTPDNVDDNDQDLQPGETEIDDNVAELTVGRARFAEGLLRVRAFAVVPIKPVVARARVKAVGLKPVPAIPTPSPTIPPAVLPNTTTTVAPTTAPTTAPPTTVKAADLVVTQSIPTTTPVIVLGETISAPAVEPAFTGSTTTPLVQLAAAALAIGGALVLVSTRRRFSRKG